MYAPKRKRKKRNYDDQMRQLFDQYEAEGHPTPASLQDVAVWAFRNRLWQPRPADVVNQCAKELARASRSEKFFDRQGRLVRAKHAVRRIRDGKQMSFWSDIRTAPRSHMAVSFGQRRNQIVGSCRGLKIDMDSYNDNHPIEPPFPMLFDFTDDLEELGTAENAA